MELFQSMIWHDMTSWILYLLNTGDDIRHLQARLVLIKSAAASETDRRYAGLTDTQ